MCLTIKTLASPHEGYVVVQKVAKRLTYSMGRYYTPYRDTAIPKNGFLVASGAGKVEQYHSHWREGIRHQISGGYVHSYTRGRPGHSALAINVTAWGEYDDLVSDIMFIPSMDKGHELAEFHKTLKMSTPVYVSIEWLLTVLPPTAKKKLTNLHHLEIV